MKINTRSKNSKNVNFKAFNVSFVETPNGLKTVGVFGASSLSSPEENWTRLDSRNFARQLKTQKLITK